MIYVDRLKYLLDRAGEAQIVFASKTQSIETLRELDKLCRGAVFGENRAQELRDKYDPTLRWQFIGRLQPNKAKYAVGKAELIQSLDSLALAGEIDRLAKKLFITQPCLIEVNISGEEAKGGIREDELKDFVRALEAYDNILIEGLMCVMPNAQADELHPLYDKLKDVFEGAKALERDRVHMKYLSAGMTNDWEIALQHGANMLRIGRYVFGERD